MKQKIILCLLCLSFLLAGCAAGEESKAVQTTNENMLGMEPEAVIAYVVPESVPGILINQVGYDVDSKKTAIFRGEELPEVFCVYNAESKQKVYEGEVTEKGYDEVTGERIAYGSFDDVITPGEYYIEADILGYSFNFCIGSEVYKELLNSNLQHIYEEMQGKTVLDEAEILSSCEALINMLLAYELHGTAFDDEMGISESGNGISDLIDILHLQSELLKNQQETVLASENGKLVSYYTAAMAKFSYTYKEYDSVFAAECLQLADVTWAYMEKNSSLTDEDMRFMAATELYRASGRQKYQYVIKEYGAAEETKLASHEAIYGAVTYLSTKQSVDIDLCSKFMEVITDEASEIAKNSKNSYYMVNLNKNDEEILWEMVVFTVVDKVLSNHEYATIIENHLHYYLGRNSHAASMIDGAGKHSYTEEEGLLPVLDGGFKESVLLFMLSEINEEM